MSDSEYKYLFGPVPSRRLGLSLGVDIVPLKTCTQDCIYCQLGKTDDKQTTRRKSFVDIEKVIKELKHKINTGMVADYITISGSGEPTLNSDIGKLIENIKTLTDIPVAVITNSTLLYIKKVRDSLCKADLVVPSLDAFDQASFEKINHPHPELNFEKIFDGLKKFCNEYNGKLWLEVFLVEGINTSDQQVEKLKQLISRLKTDKVQLNTAVRPAARAGLKPLSPENLERISKLLDNNVEVIVDYSRINKILDVIEKSQESVYQMLKRRPCSIKDITASLGINPNQALKHITALLNSGRITSETVGEENYYRAI